MADSTDTRTTSQEEYNKNPSSNFLSRLNDKAKYSNSINIATRLNNINEIERDLEKEIEDIHEELTSGTVDDNPYKFEQVTFNPVNINSNINNKDSNKCQEYKIEVNNKLRDIESKYNTLKGKASGYATKLND